MAKVIHLLFLGFIVIAVANSFSLSRKLNLEQKGRAPGMDERTSKHITFLKDKFQFLKKKSEILDKNVETNDKLLYVTRSDNFEEALFLIDYLNDRLLEFEDTNTESRDVVLTDIGFYLKRLEDNLAIVERDLIVLDSKGKRVSKR